MSLIVTREPAEAGFDAARLDRIRAHFDRYVADERLSGWLATVARGSDLVWVGRGGHADREAGVPVSEDTIWRIYSMTKPLTSLAAMMLYEEGAFDLNDEVSSYVEEFAEARVFLGGTPEAPRTRAPEEPVRVLHLLTHTAGLTYGFHYTHPVDAIYRLHGYDFGYPPGTDLARAVADWARLPLIADPGRHFNYSVATDVLGRLVEVWSGLSLDRFMRERILEPLGMYDTDWYCPPEKAERLARLYVPSQGRAVAFDELGRYALKWPSMLGGGGGLLASAGDYWRFTQMLLGRGALGTQRLISPASLELMTRNHLPAGADIASSALDTFAVPEYAGVGFGLGFSVVLDQVANRSLVTEGSYAWGGAASTVFWVDPAEEITVSFFTQMLPSSTYPVRRELQRLVYAAAVG